MTDAIVEATRAPCGWMRNAQTRTYRKGETIIRAGSAVDEWMAISGGVVCLETAALANVKAAVATLWFGDVLGFGSPLGSHVAAYEVTALGNVETVAIARIAEGGQVMADTAHLYTATAARLNRQIAMRLTGNGPQRLLSVLATLGEAFAQGAARAHRPHALALPIAQSCLGQLAGLSRRQVWVYLGELAKAGWVQTSRTRVILHNVSAWLLLHGEVERRGLGCISTIGHSVDTLSSLVGRAAPA